MSLHSITVQRSGNQDGMDWEAEYVITFGYRPGRPEKRYLRNGDPGYPADPDEIEFVSISPDAGDHGVFSDLAQSGLIEWATDWLEGDGYEKALEVVAFDMERAREDAADMRRGER